LLLGIGLVAGILLVLTTAFRSLKDVLVIILKLPLALVGGFVGVFLPRCLLSVASPTP